MYEDVHLESAYEDRFEYDSDWYALRERDWDEEKEAERLDKDEADPDPTRDAYRDLTGDDMEADQGVPNPHGWTTMPGEDWIIAPGY